MPQIPDIGVIAEKWERVTPQRTVDYEQGVRNPKVNWADATLAAEATYVEAVSQAIAEGRFGRGVRAAGTRKWQEKTIAKGPVRWSQGVRLAGVDFAAGFQPYRDLIAQIVLPPRGPKGDPRNLERVRAIDDALHALKLRIG
jgi:hypothetical protein